MCIVCELQLFSVVAELSNTKNRGDHFGFLKPTSLKTSSSQVMSKIGFFFHYDIKRGSCSALPPLCCRRPSLFNLWCPSVKKQTKNNWFLMFVFIAVYCSLSLKTGEVILASWKLLAWRYQAAKGCARNHFFSMRGSCSSVQKQREEKCPKSCRSHFISVSTLQMCMRHCVVCLSKE